jgi:RNA polymerase sigma factor (sigma-70 family)
MGTVEIIKQLGNKEFLDKLYGFAYKRCNSSFEAEDLCSDIVLALLKSIRKAPSIKNFYAFTWTVARRTYADFCEKRKQQSDKNIAENYTDEIINIQTNPIDDYIESEAEITQFKKIKREITFLSKMYRDVMVMYYLDEMKTLEIARKLAISETTVKQRLFFARNTIRKEVDKMDNNNLSLKPVRIAFMGTGNPVGNDPREKAERTFSQNLVYLCKDIARSAKEISEMLNVPMMFIEEEIEIQCHGMNKHYGLIRKLDNGKYISNFIIIDSEDFKTVNEIYKQQADVIIDRMATYFKTNEKRILDFPFLNKQSDIKFIAWSLISRMIWTYESNIFQTLKNKYFPDIETLEREFSIFGIAAKYGENIKFGFYGCDGNKALNFCGYSLVFYANIYGERIEKHFSCGHNISNDPLLLLTIKAIDGIAVDNLSGDEKEIAAKAIEVGYLKKENGILLPKILVLNMKDEKEFYSLSNDFAKEIEDVSNASASNIYELVKKFVPKHLMNEYKQFVLHSTCGLISDVFEKCIKKGIINAPERRLCAEGTWMIVAK